MLRNCSLEDISDGRLYTAEEMAKINCHDCQGCDQCCHGMGNSILLDPYDFYQLEIGCGENFNSLMNGKIELNITDGLILPNIAMKEGEECCSFLNEKGRCKIHDYRPGFCRLFPLGRYYEEQGFRYFIQKEECPLTNRSKMKIKQWLGIEHIKKYEAFVLQWHDLLKSCQSVIQKAENEAVQKEVCMGLLTIFFTIPYEKDDFYSQFALRCQDFTEKYLT